MAGTKPGHDEKPGKCRMLFNSYLFIFLFLPVITGRLFHVRTPR